MTPLSCKLLTAGRGEHATAPNPGRGPRCARCPRLGGGGRLGPSSGLPARSLHPKGLASPPRWPGCPAGPVPRPTSLRVGPLGQLMENPPSMGVLGSGRLANTTSTYSSCSRSREAFRPGRSGREGHRHHRLPGPPPEPEGEGRGGQLGAVEARGEANVLRWDVGGPSRVSRGVTGREGQHVWHPPHPRPRASETHQS